MSMNSQIETYDNMSSLPIYCTNDYSVFGSIDGNRNINHLHVNRLTKSMQEKYLICPILVNEKMQVIDGQHRLQAIRGLGLPCYYIIVQGYGLRDVQLLNAANKTWNCDDYLKGYVDLKRGDYMVYRNFKDKYGFSHNECLSLLTGNGNGDSIKKFYRGELKVKNFQRATKIAQYILDIGQFYEGYKRRVFVKAIIRLFSNENFDSVHFIANAEKYKSMFYDCPSVGSTIEMIENIYNYRKHKKTNLRF